MKVIYQLFRVACFIALPLFFQRKELTPQPLKNMLLAFIASVAISELFLYFTTSVKLRPTLFPLPLIAVILAILPYRSDIGYFETADRFLIYSVICAGVIYFFDRKYLYPKVFR